MANTSGRTKKGAPIESLDFIIDAMILPFLNKMEDNRHGKNTLHNKNLAKNN